MVRITFRSAGFRELLTSAAAKALLTKQASEIAIAANAVPSTTEPAATEPYYRVEDASDGKRARVRIVTANSRAARHEAKTLALQRNMR